MSGTSRDTAPQELGLSLPEWPVERKIKNRKRNETGEQFLKDVLTASHQILVNIRRVNRVLTNIKTHPQTRPET